MAETATYIEKRAIHDLLIEHLHSIEGSKLFRYDDGWSDLRAAQTVRETLTANPAAKIRREVYGKLAYAQGGPGKREQDTRINALEKYTRQLAGEIRRLADMCDLSAGERSDVFRNVHASNLADEDSLPF